MFDGSSHFNTVRIKTGSKKLVRDCNFIEPPEKQSRSSDSSTWNSFRGDDVIDIKPTLNTLVAACYGNGKNSHLLCEKLPSPHVSVLSTGQPDRPVSREKHSSLVDVTKNAGDFPPFRSSSTSFLRHNLDCCEKCKEYLIDKNRIRLACMHCFCAECLLRRNHFCIDPTPSGVLKNENNKMFEEQSLDEIPDEAFENFENLKTYLNDNLVASNQLLVMCEICQKSTQAKVLVTKYFPSITSNGTLSHHIRDSLGGIKSCEVSEKDTPDVRPYSDALVRGGIKELPKSVIVEQHPFNATKIESLDDVFRPNNENILSWKGKIVKLSPNSANLSPQSWFERNENVFPTEDAPALPNVENENLDFSDSDNEYDGFDRDDSDSCRDSDDVGDMDDADPQFLESWAELEKNSSVVEEKSGEKLEFMENSCRQQSQQSSTSVPWSDDVASSPPQISFTEERWVNPLTNPTPMSTLQLCFDEEFFENLARQTNLCALLHSKTRKIESARSRCAHWDDVTPAELKRFVGLILIMGLNPRPKTFLYWSTKICWRTPVFGAVMSRDRFKNILKFLHFVDIREQKDPEVSQDALWKVRPLISLLISKFKNQCYPGKELCFYKAKFMGRKLRVYDPNFTNKKLRLYEVCDAQTGYCCNFKIELQESPSDVNDTALELLRDYLEKGHEVYMDRYCSSVSLFQCLWLKHTVAVGPCWTNRTGLLPLFFRRKSPSDLVRAWRQGPLLALNWGQRRDGLLLSTKHTPELETSLTRAVCNSSKHKAVLEYKTNMLGINKNDHTLRFYSFDRRTESCWRKIFFHLISLTVANAHKLYNLSRSGQDQSGMTFLEFVENVAEELTGTVLVEDENSAISRQNRILSEPNRHFPERIASKNRSGRACVVCSAERKSRRKENNDKKNTRRSTIQCSLCRVALCIDPCFAKYHSCKNFAQ